MWGGGWTRVPGSGGPAPRGIGWEPERLEEGSPGRGCCSEELRAPGPRWDLVSRRPLVATSHIMLRLPLGGPGWGVALGSCLCDCGISRGGQSQPAPLLALPPPPGFLHSERQDHREEGCCCTFWGLLPHHRDAELWGESQSGSASPKWLGASPLDLPCLLSLALCRTRCPVPASPPGLLTQQAPGSA